MTKCNIIYNTMDILLRISIVYLNSEYQITTFQKEEEIGISPSSKIKFAGIEFKSPIGGYSHRVSLGC